MGKMVNTYQSTAADGQHFVRRARNILRISRFIVAIVAASFVTAAAIANGQDTTPPASPTGLIATASIAAISLDWDDNAESDLAGYKVERSTTASGPWTLLNSLLLSTSAYNDGTAQPGVTSYYRVVAVDQSVNPSAPASTSAARLFTTITWKSATAAPLKRAEGFGGFANGKLYLFGGYYGDAHFTPTQRADAYDPATNMWTRIADLPIGLSHVGAAVDGANFYFAGGYPTQAGGTGQTFSTAAVWKYNTTTNTYAAMPSLPLARGGGALVRDGRVLHYFGGSGPARKDTGTHWALNIDTGTAWTTRAPMPIAVNHLGSVLLNGKIYAVGGQSGQDAAATIRNNVDAYDPTTNTWTAVAPLPLARSHHEASTFVMGERIIVVGGKSAIGARLASVTAYDPRTNTWTELTPLPVAKSAPVGDQVNGVLYVTTGNTVASTHKGVPVAP
ncbi:MAG: hypothetical protein H0U43_04765 [Chthoniobacterales bacterium]|nr:hypothetical protein [Chthoniobacterales bacterium]